MLPFLLHHQCNVKFKQQIVNYISSDQMLQLYEVWHAWLKSHVHIRKFEALDDDAADRLEASKLQPPKALPPSERSKFFFFQTFKSACMFDTILCSKHSITSIWHQIHITPKVLIALEWIIMACTHTLIAVDSIYCKILTLQTYQCKIS